MRKLHLVAASAVAVLFVAACGSDPETEKDFYKGSQTGAAGGGGTEYPSFTPVVYPAGPYGTEVGSVVENYELLGWKAPAAANYDVGAFETVSLADLYDPDGSKGIKLLFINSSAVWCSVCNAEFAYMKSAGTYAEYRPKGVEFISTLFEDAANPPKPAKPSDLAGWGSKYDVQFPMQLDPGFKWGRFFTADATPMNLIVDARTMVIKEKILGGDIKGVLAKIDYHLSQMQ